LLENFNLSAQEQYFIDILILIKMQFRLVIFFFNQIIDRIIFSLKSDERAVNFLQLYQKIETEIRYVLKKDRLKH
jgi:hypothetical protein